MLEPRFLASCSTHSREHLGRGGPLAWSLDMALSCCGHSGLEKRSRKPLRLSKCFALLNIGRDYKRPEACRKDMLRSKAGFAVATDAFLRLRDGRNYQERQRGRRCTKSHACNRGILGEFFSFNRPHGHGMSAREPLHSASQASGHDGRRSERRRSLPREKQS